MDLDTEQMRTLVSRIRALMDHPPAADPLHAFALLAGAQPEHLVAHYTEPIGGEPARWQLIGLTEKRLTIVDAEGTGERGWTWPQNSRFNDSGKAKTLYAKTFTVREITGISVTDLRSESWESQGMPVLGAATATWSIHTTERVFELPRKWSRDDAAEELMMSLRDHL